MGEIAVDDMNVETALARAPETKGYPAITPEFLALLRHKGFRWDAQGLMQGSAQNPMERLPLWLTPFSLKARGKCVWWVGDSAARCTCSPADFAALLKGRALKNGMILAGGESRRLVYSKGWACLAPGFAEPAKIRQNLVTLSNNVLGFVQRYDAAMKDARRAPAERVMGNVAKLVDALDMANQQARYFGLDCRTESQAKRKLPGGVK